MVPEPESTIHVPEATRPMVPALATGKTLAEVLDPGMDPDVRAALLAEEG